jgi:hypothetical protein
MTSAFPSPPYNANKIETIDIADRYWGFGRRSCCGSGNNIAMA